MKRESRAKWLALATAIVLLAADASAQERQSLFRERDDQRPRRMMPDARQTQFTPEDDAAQRRGMTPEERRQLRRDVHDAGRDLYPERMRERRREMRRSE